MRVLLLRLRLFVHFFFFIVAAAYYAYRQATGEDAGPLIFLLLGIVVLVPLERLMPRHPQNTFRRGLLVDLVHVMVTGLLSFLPIMLIFPLLDPIRMQSLVALVAGLPLGVQIALAFLTQSF